MSLIAIRHSMNYELSKRRYSALTHDYGTKTPENSRTCRKIDRNKSVERSLQRFAGEMVFRELVFRWNSSYLDDLLACCLGGS